MKVNLSVAPCARAVAITLTAFPTRHISTGAPAETPPATITPNPPIPEPVIPAYNKARKENRQRVLDFLTYGFCGNLSGG